MKRGEEPPNWAELCRFSSEFSILEAVNLTEDWLSKSLVVGKSDRPIAEKQGARTDIIKLLPDAKFF